MTEQKPAEAAMVEIDLSKRRDLHVHFDCDPDQTNYRPTASGPCIIGPVPNK